MKSKCVSTQVLERRTSGRLPFRGFLLSILLLSTANAAIWAQAAALMPNAEIKGPWLGQELPGDTPIPFAPTILKSVSAWVEAIEFSPDGSLCLISVGSPRYTSAKLFQSSMEEGRWTSFVEPPFAASFEYSHEPVFSFDGRSLMFTGMKSGGSKDLWTVSYDDGKWGEPIALPSPINSESAEFRGSYTRDGILYFGSERSGMMQVYRARFAGAQAPEVSLVEDPISIGKMEGDPCIAPDGSFIIFYSCKDNRSANLFVSFLDGTGAWGKPIKLGSEYNSGNDEYGAHLSVDGKFLFFTRHGTAGNIIFWVSISAIERLKPSVP